MWVNHHIYFILETRSDVCVKICYCIYICICFHIWGSLNIVFFVSKQQDGIQKRLIYIKKLNYGKNLMHKSNCKILVMLTLFIKLFVLAVRIMIKADVLRTSVARILNKFKVYTYIQGILLLSFAINPAKYTIRTTISGGIGQSDHPFLELFSDPEIRQMLRILP